MLASADTRKQRRPGKTAATPRLPPTICTALRCAAPAHAVCLANVGILWVRTWASSRGTGSVLHWRIREIVTGAMSRIVVTLSRKAERKAVVSLHSRRRRSRGREWRQRQGWQGKVDGPWLGITSGGIRCREHLSRLLRAVGAARHCPAMQSALADCRAPPPHMSMRLSAHIRPLLSRTAQALSSSNMPCRGAAAGGAAGKCVGDSTSHSLRAPLLQRAASGNTRQCPLPVQPAAASAASPCP